MQAELAPPVAFSDEASPGTVVARHTGRRAVRSGVLWGYVFGVFVASSALSYTTIYRTPAARDRLASGFSSNNAARALFGPAPQLQTVAGFTVFKTSMTLIVLGGVWGLLTSTRLLRGEEEAGRWEILLIGRTTRGGAAGQALVGLGAGLAVLWAITAAVTVVTGLSSKVHIGVAAGSFLAVALVANAVMFVAFGALTSQLVATRRQAASAAAAFLGVSYALRLVADAGIGAHWLIWATPIGWVEELRPLTAPQPLALVPITGFTAVLVVVAIRLAGRRDVGASTFPDRPSSVPRLRLLSGPTGLTVRLMRPAAVGWAIALAASGLMMGLVASAAGGTISGSSVQEVFSRLGATGTGATAFLGVAFLIIAVLIASVAAGQVTAARAEEAVGHLDHLLVRPVSRRTWFAGRMLLAAAIVIAGGFVSGLFAWFGAAGEHSGVAPVALVAAGLNAAAPALCILGAGALAFGAWPRSSSIVVYTMLGWSVLVSTVGGIGALDHWVSDTSVFHQMASAPAVPPDWSVDAVLVAIGVVCAIGGALAFTRRDIETE